MGFKGGPRKPERRRESPIDVEESRLIRENAIKKIWDSLKIPNIVLALAEVLQIDEKEKRKLEILRKILQLSGYQFNTLEDILNNIIPKKLPDDYKACVYLLIISEHLVNVFERLIELYNSLKEILQKRLKDWREVEQEYQGRLKEISEKIQQASVSMTEEERRELQQREEEIRTELERVKKQIESLNTRIEGGEDKIGIEGKIKEIEERYLQPLKDFIITMYHNLEVINILKSIEQAINEYMSEVSEVSEEKKEVIAYEIAQIWNEGLENSLIEILEKMGIIESDVGEFLKNQMERFELENRLSSFINNMNNFNSRRLSLSKINQKEYSKIAFLLIIGEYLQKFLEFPDFYLQFLTYKSEGLQQSSISIEEYLKGMRQFLVHLNILNLSKEINEYLRIIKDFLRNYGNIEQIKEEKEKLNRQISRKTQKTK